MLLKRKVVNRWQVATGKQVLGREEPGRVMTIGSLLIPSSGRSESRVIYGLSHLHHVATITQLRGRNGSTRGSAGVSPAPSCASSWPSIDLCFQV